jgi:hypothetical protein
MLRLPGFSTVLFGVLAHDCRNILYIIVIPEDTGLIIYKEKTIVFYIKMVIFENKEQLILKHTIKISNVLSNFDRVVPYLRGIYSVMISLSLTVRGRQPTQKVTSPLSF